MTDGEELLAAREDELDRRPAARASAATWASKWKSHFAPKPPPSRGTTTRTFDSGIPSVWATPARATNGTCVDDQIVTRSPCHSRDDRARLDRDALGRIGHVPALDDDVGCGEGRVDVALRDRRVAEQVVVPAERLVALVGLPVRMHGRRVVGERRLEVGQHRERLEVDLDERRRLACELGCQRRDAGDESPSKRTVSRAKRRRSCTEPP